MDRITIEKWIEMVKLDANIEVVIKENFDDSSFIYQGDVSKIPVEVYKNEIIGFEINNKKMLIQEKGGFRVETIPVISVMIVLHQQN